MTDSTLMNLAIALELGLPVVLAIAAIVWPRIRKWAVVVFGAITPVLLFFAVTVVLALGLGDQGAAIAFDGMWRTSLVPFAACAVLGAVLGLLRVPSTPFLRYTLGLLPPSALAVVLAVVWPQ